MQINILIIGGGLSGLSLAEHLSSTRRDIMLVEARSRFGGRIKTETAQGGYVDMGPAWFWPGQPRIAALITRLGLAQFDQFYAGDLIYEDETGRVQQGKGLASMQGSFRLRAVDNPKLEATAMLPLLEGAQLAPRAEENLDCSTMPYAF